MLTICMLQAPHCTPKHHRIALTFAASPGVHVKSGILECWPCTAGYTEAQTRHACKLICSMHVLLCCVRTQLPEAVLHELHLLLSLLAAQAAHHDALAGGDLLVARVHQIGQRLKGVAGSQAGVPGEHDRHWVVGGGGLVGHQRDFTLATSHTDRWGCIVTTPSVITASVVTPALRLCSAVSPAGYGPVATGNTQAPRSSRRQTHLNTPTCCCLRRGQSKAPSTQSLAVCLAV